MSIIGLEDLARPDFKASIEADILSLLLSSALDKSMLGTEDAINRRQIGLLPVEISIRLSDA